IHLVGVGEFDGDGAPDLVFTYDIITDGQPIRHVMVSFADGDFQEAVQWVNTDLWNVTAIGDIDADGISDIFVTPLAFPQHNVVMIIERGEDGTLIPGRPAIIPFPAEHAGDDMRLVGV